MLHVECTLHAKTVYKSPTISKVVSRTDMDMIWATKTKRQQTYKDITKTYKIPIFFLEH